MQSKAALKSYAITATASPRDLAATQSACEHARAIATDRLGLNPDWASGKILCCSSHSSRESLTSISKTLLKAGKIEIGL